MSKKTRGGRRQTREDSHGKAAASNNFKSGKVKKLEEIMHCKQVPPRAVIRIFMVILSLLLLGAGSAITTAAETDAGCGYSITLKEAAGILTVPGDDLQKSSRKIMVSPDDLREKTYQGIPCIYHFRSKTNFLKSINYTVYVYSDPGRARREFEKMRGNFSTVSRVEEVPGLGDETFRVNDKRFQRMIAIKGGVMIDVLTPADPNLQKQLLRLVL
jgi:hypothetical protein